MARAVLRGDLLLDEREIVAHQIENPFGDLDGESHRSILPGAHHFDWDCSTRSVWPDSALSRKNRRKFAAVRGRNFIGG